MIKVLNARLTAPFMLEIDFSDHTQAEQIALVDEILLRRPNCTNLHRPSEVHLDD